MSSGNFGINTDYKGSQGDPEDSLRHIGEAGFTHLHWCHQWNTSHLYTDREIAKIAAMMQRYGLKLLDIHGSDGSGSGFTSCWYSEDEVYRQSGVELVLNRLRMFAMLRGEGALMMHPPYHQNNESEAARASIERKVDAFRKTLDELVPICQALKIPLALENLPRDTYEVLPRLFAEYPADVVGLCYDSGHGNIMDSNGHAGGMEFLETHKDRLMALHLHDNDGTGDQHFLPFYGNVDWARLVRAIRSSAYPRILSFEVGMRSSGPGPSTPGEFCREAMERFRKVDALA